MVLYHSKGGYPFLEIHPYGSDLEEAIAQTTVQPVTANGVFILMIVIQLLYQRRGISDGI